MKNQITIAFLIAISIASCRPANAIVPTQITTLLDNTLTPTALINKPTNTLSPTSTPTLVPFFTPTTTPRPVLISDTSYSDGGHELFICLNGIAQPSFILYEDGELIMLRDGYKQAILSQDEIDELLNTISGTGLFERSEKEYSEGSTELMINGKRYFLAFDAPPSDPLRKTFDIIVNFEPENMSQYIPESLRLEIYPIDGLELISGFLPQPTPEVDNWINSPLYEFGEGWHIISEENIPTVMKQFNKFPDFRIFQEGSQYYVASICANIRNQ